MSATNVKKKMKKKKKNKSEGTSSCSKKDVYLPGDSMEEGEELICDDSTYVMLHHATTVSPCLSFDFIRDKLGEGRREFPHHLYLVAGTQSARSNANSLVVMKMGNLRKTQKGDDDDDDDDDDDSSSSDEDDDDDAQGLKKPELSAALIKHPGGCNRVRCLTRPEGDVSLVASWSELGRVCIWSLEEAWRSLEARGGALGSVEARGGALGSVEARGGALGSVGERGGALGSVEVRGGASHHFTHNSSSYLPLYSFTGHQSEGFALDWSSSTFGRLVTGDCKGHIHVWEPESDVSGWRVDQRSYRGHTQSVEDLQWSPSEDTVFASCSVDRSIRIWDIRASPHEACMLTNPSAHSTDVNVISWNTIEPFILSGDDDGLLKVWDLRQFQTNQPLATLSHHKSSITSVEWHPTDGSVFASSGADNQLCQWDLSVEVTDSSMREGGEALPRERGETVPREGGETVPQQLLFIHQGQRDLKELHWHPQIPGLIVSTASDGLNVFKTISV